MKKKLLAAFMACLILFSAGCGDADTAASESSSDSAATAPSETSATAAEASEAAADDTQETPDLWLIDDKYRTWYEVFVYSFYDSDGDGIGDLRGLIAKLDYINDGNPATDTDLGCTGIWLMPVNPSTTYHKYDVTDYYDIDPEYGTLDDFKELVTACHERGVNVCMDFVMNHTSSQHEWFQTAVEYLKALPADAEPDTAECPYVDYYHFSREYDSGYTQIEGTEWYYESQFWSEMPDLNLESEAVRAEFEAIVDFWLELGVDAFRLDAAKEYDTGNADANIEILSWFNTMVKEKDPDAYIVAEVWTDQTAYVKYYASGIDSVFDFSFADKDGTISSVLNGGSASSYGKALIAIQEALSAYDTAIDAPFYTNHDMARGAGYYAGDYSEQQTKMGQAMNLTMTGSAFLYYGEELGMKGSGKDENKRAPMYWSEDADAEGMCDGPADMDSVKMKYGALETQETDETSVYSFVKEVIRLRNTYPEIARGTVMFEETLSDESICVIRKTWEDEECLLVYNTSSETASVDLTGLTLGTDGHSANTLNEALVTGGEAAELTDGVLTLPGYSMALLK